MFPTTLMLLIAAPGSVGAGDRCALPGADRVAARTAAPARARPLNEMPPARSVLAVYAQVDGCAVLRIRDGTRIVEEPAGIPDRRPVFRR